VLQAVASSPTSPCVCVIVEGVYSRIRRFRGGGDLPISLGSARKNESDRYEMMLGPKHCVGSYPIVRYDETGSATPTRSAMHTPGYALVPVLLNSQYTFYSWQ